MAISAQERIKMYHQAKARGDTKEESKQFKLIMKAAQERIRELEKIDKRAEMVTRATQGNKKAQKWVELHETRRDDEYFRGILNFKYKKTISDMQTRLGFTSFERKPKTEQQARAMMAIAQDFILSPSSSRKGILDVYKRRVDTINNKFGTSFTWKDFAKLALTDEFKELINDEKYSSDSIIIALGELVKSKDPKKTIEAIKSGADKTILSDDPRSEVIEKAIKEGIFDRIVNYL